MKKTFLTIFMVIALCGYVSTAGAYNIGFVGSVSDSGTGFGNISNILTLQNNGSETGSVAWNGSSDVLSGDAKNTSQTWLFSDIIAKGITNASELGIVYNVNQEGKDSALNTNLINFSLQVYDGAGALVGGIPVGDSAAFGSPNVYPPIAQGTGGAGYLFDLLSGYEIALAPYFLAANADQYRFGMYASIEDSNDGPENFFFAKISGVTPVPEPGTLLLLGFGLIGLAGFSRRKFKNR